ncbi:hypothetical protein DPMN_002563 [Dreissena polymorpha]|uniref:Uncharacterized protein n=1 Tax=Dreissena polymorpha TaxID=45954 RepID=A0A9D4MM82_DREPO|nr:hypothetical protein DPMN_002563 [Dreissena polymorpha]
MYYIRLNELGLKGVTEVHTIRLKNRLLSALPSLREYTEKGRVILAFDKDVGSVLKQVSEQDFDSEALLLSKVAKIVRRDSAKAEIHCQFFRRLPNQIGS